MNKQQQIKKLFAQLSEDEMVDMIKELERIESHKSELSQPKVYTEVRTEPNTPFHFSFEKSDEERWMDSSRYYYVDLENPSEPIIHDESCGYCWLLSDIMDEDMLIVSKKATSWSADPDYIKTRLEEILKNRLLGSEREILREYYGLRGEYYSWHNTAEEIARNMNLKPDVVTRRRKAALKSLREPHTLSTLKSMLLFHFDGYVDAVTGEPSSDPIVSDTPLLLVRLSRSQHIDQFKHGLMTREDISRKRSKEYEKLSETILRAEEYVQAKQSKR